MAHASQRPTGFSSFLLSSLNHLRLPVRLSPKPPKSCTNSMPPLAPTTPKGAATGLKKTSVVHTRERTGSESLYYVDAVGEYILWMYLVNPQDDTVHTCSESRLL